MSNPEGDSSEGVSWVQALYIPVQGLALQCFPILASVSMFYFVLLFFLVIG